MKKLVTIILSIAIVLSFAAPAYAGTWKQSYNGWQYVKDDGTLIINQWFQDVDGKWYHFDYNGNMQHDKWIDRLYYLGSDGAMLVNTTAPNGMRLGPDGTIVFNPNAGTWLKDDIGTWFRQADGSIARDCILEKKSTGEKYYFNEDGYLMTDEELEEYFEEIAYSKARNQLRNSYQTYANQYTPKTCSHCGGTGVIQELGSGLSIPSAYTSSENYGIEAAKSLQNQFATKTCPYCNGRGYTY